MKCPIITGSRKRGRSFKMVILPIKRGRGACTMPPRPRSPSCPRSTPPGPPRTAPPTPASLPPSPRPSARPLRAPRHHRSVRARSDSRRPRSSSPEATHTRNVALRDRVASRPHVPSPRPARPHPNAWTPSTPHRRPSPSPAPPRPPPLNSASTAAARTRRNEAAAPASRSRIQRATRWT